MCQGAVGGGWASCQIFGNLQPQASNSSVITEGLVISEPLNAVDVLAALKRSLKSWPKVFLMWINLA
jgi:hypothetical protein